LKSNIDGFLNQVDTLALKKHDPFMPRITDPAIAHE